MFVSRDFEINFEELLEINIDRFNKYARDKCMPIDYYFTDLSIIVARYIDYKLNKNKKEV